MPRTFLTIFLLLFLPIACYADGGVRALGALIDLSLFFSYSLTAFSIFLAFKFYSNRKAGIKQIVLFISVLLALFGLKIMLIYSLSIDYDQIESYRQEDSTMLLVGVSIFLPNLLIALMLPWFKSYSRLEFILGRISENKDVIIWGRIKREVTTGQIQLTYHQALDNLRKESRDFYNLVDLGFWEDGETQNFNNYQAAVDYLRSSYAGVKIVSAGMLQPEYLKLLRAEKLQT